MSTTLIQLFARPPVKGKVKTRLSADIGDDKALSVYCHCLGHCLSLVRDSAFDYQLWFSEPPTPWAEDDPLHIQQGRDLGEKMHFAMSSALKHTHPPHERVILIGSDCIDLTPQILNKVNDQLDHYDVVIVPAKDGGYVLIAARLFIHPGLFENIAWGSQFVLRQTLENVMQLRIHACILDPLRDIDRYDDLQHYDVFQSYLQPTTN